MSQVQSTEDFEALLEYIKLSRGFDLSGYKRPSLIRRISKRMQAVGLDEYNAYRDRLELHPEEFVDLFDTILINVTSFFRDPATWEYVAQEVVPRLVLEKAEVEPIRVWSTGCATGEEAYTVAMILAEELGEEAFRARVKIYATDIDEDALVYGRHAVYSQKQMQPVPAELREKYFERSDGGFVFRPDLRRSVIFGRNDLIQDPPISRVDLLVSRNTLMYFTPRDAGGRPLQLLLRSQRQRLPPAREVGGAADADEPLRAERPEAARLPEGPADAHPRPAARPGQRAGGPGPAGEGVGFPAQGRHDRAGARRAVDRGAGRRARARQPAGARDVRRLAARRRPPLQRARHLLSPGRAPFRDRTGSFGGSPDQHARRQLADPRR